MAGRRAPSRRAVVQAQTPKVSDQQTQRALDVVHQAVLDLQKRQHAGAAATLVTGSRSSGAALESLLAALVELGIITDETSA